MAGRGLRALTQDTDINARGNQAQDRPPAGLCPTRMLPLTHPRSRTWSSLASLLLKDSRRCSCMVSFRSWGVRGKRLPGEAVGEHEREQRERASTARPPRARLKSRKTDARAVLAVIWTMVSTLSVSWRGCSGDRQ